MNDLITLTCPSCGGKLQFSANTTSLVCPNCSNEHIVRRQGDAFQIEASSRCPNCNRNDRVEKVSAILSGQTHTVTGTRPVTDVYTDSEGKVRSSTSYESYTTTQTSVLAQRLSPPLKPSAGGTCGSVIVTLFLVVVAGPIMIFQIGLPIAFLDSGGSQLICAFPAFIVGALLIWAGVKFYQKSSADYKKRVAQLEAVDLPRWGHAMERWNKLYYCYRDDVVFIPGDGKSATTAQTREYIYEA